MSTAVQRRLPVGAEPVDGGTHFRVWAPRPRLVEVVLEESSRSFRMESEQGGYFSGFVDNIGHGTLYRFRLDVCPGLCPDPASRFQPEGPHGPSQIVDSGRYSWRNLDWKGVHIEGQVIYEMHIGTFTREGTWRAAQDHLPELASTGITLIEVMPIADFAGTFGWGYDGVDPFAPSRLYGTPDDFRAFVDAAHGNGIGVILDVVYNHAGPDGNYLKAFSDDYFTDKHANDWGEAFNFDGPNSQPVREFVLANARYWIEEFHLDGLRLDATQQIYDSSADNILAAITRESRDAAGGRSIIVIAENEPQRARLVRSAEFRGYGLDAIWNDDFHHMAFVAATGRSEAYYTDYRGTPQEFVSAAKWGFLYQGQYYSWQKNKRGSSALDLKPSSLITFIQNHDQIANSASGKRLHELTTPGRYRALTALMLLIPGTPMLFQGQEFCASSPFLYFADHHESLACQVEAGRENFLDQFPSIRYSRTHYASGLPRDRRTFERCKLDHSERRSNAQMLEFHKDLLKLRREDAIFRAQRSDWIHGAVLGPEAFLLRFFGGLYGDRLILVNLGRDLPLTPAPEPLLAPPENARWEILWSSEDPRYGGAPRAPVSRTGVWNISGHSAVVLYEKPNAS